MDGVDDLAGAPNVVRSRRRLVLRIGRARHIDRVRLAARPLDDKLAGAARLDHDSGLVAGFRSSFRCGDRGVNGGTLVGVRPEVPTFKSDFPKSVVLYDNILRTQHV
jgi:hypothetical protein